MAKSSRKSSRKAERKNSRKGSRKAERKNSRKGSCRCWTRRNNMSGGASPIGNTSMAGSTAMSLAQGRDYLNLHKGQYGGAAVSLAAAAPVGYTGVLDDALRATARITPLDSAIGDIQGLRDQSGGGKRRKGKKALTKKVRALRAKLVKIMKKMSRRKMRGGAATPLQSMADYGAPGMLLSPAQEAKAMMGMNPEWKLASDPAAFAPK